MKKRVLSVAALLFGSVAVNAQVGIGTIKPNKSAELLIESANRGLLIPNVALLDTKDKTTISNGNVESLMVFATKSQGDITPGYYYWNINKWVRLTADKDIPGIVVNNFQEIVNMEGDKVQNIIKNIVRNTEGNVIYEGDKFYQVINKDGNIIKQEITDKITHIEYDDLTGDYIYYNENAVDRQGNIDKNKGVRIQVKQTVINKFKDIINDQTVQQHINNFLEGTYVGGNVYYDGTKFTYVTKAGETKEITIKEIVTANETVTTLVKNGDGTYTYTSENNTKTIIDIPSEFVEHFEKIIEQPVTVDGRTFTTINDYIKYVTESKGGFTKIVYNKDGDVIFQEWNETKQEWVNVDNSKFTTIVKSNETVTLLVPNANGTFTYYNEKQIGADGQPKAGETGVTIDPKEVSVALNTTSNKYEFKNSKGDVIGEIDANANAIVYNDNSTNLGVTNVQEAIEKLLQKITEVAGTTGDLSVAGGLEFVEKTSGLGKLLADAKIQIADKGVTSEKLNAGTGDADRVGVADKDGNVVYKTLDEVVKSNETVTLLVPNANGTFTYYNEKQIGADGQPKAGETGVTIDPKEVSVALNTTSNKYEFKNSKGDVIGEIDANANAITFNNATNGFTSTNVQDALEELKNTINTNKGDLSVAGGLEFTSGTNGTTKLLSDAGIQIADKGVTSEKLNAGTGDTDRVGVADKDGNVVYKTLDEVVKSNETVTLLVPNANGTFTYYNEKQIGADGQPKVGETGVTIDPKEVSVALNTTSNKYEFKNSKGDVIGEIDANANAITFNNTTNGFTSTNVQDALEELKNTINTNKGDLSVAGGLEFTGGTNGTTKLLSDAGIQIADKGVTSEKLNAGTGDADRVGVADKDGNVVYKTLDEVVKSNETVTLLVPNANGTFTYYNEKQIGADGQPKAGETGVTIDPKEVSVALNTTSNKYEFKNSKGDVIGEIDANANAIVYNDNSTNLGVTNVQEAIEKLLQKITEVAGTTGDLSVAGGLEFTSGTNGTTKLLSDAGIQIADKGVTSEKLNAGTGDADRVGVADKDGNVVYKTLDEVVKSNETVTLLVPNADGTFTYYNEKQIGADGQPKAGETGVTIDPKEVSVALNTTSNKYEFKNSKGDVIGEIDANANAITFNNTTNGFTSTNVQDALEELKNTINTNKGNLSVAGGLEFTGGTNGTTKLLSDAGIQIADKGVTSEKLNAGTGDTDRVGVADKDGNVVYKTLDEVVKSNETVTLLVPNANGTFTYYNEKQIGADGQPKAGETGVTIDPKEVSVALNTTSNKYEFKNSKGDVIGEIDANANAIVYNDNSTNLGVTNVQEAIEKLLQKITEVAGTTGDLSVAGGLEFTSGTNGTTKLLSDAGIQIADKGVTSEKLNAGTGDADRVGVADKDGNVVYKTLDEVVKSNETVTLLVPNADGTFTYYNEKQIGADGQPKAGETGVTIDPKEVSVALNTTSNKYEFKNSKGDVIGEIDANANAITFNNTTNGFTSTNVQDALEELKNTINTNKGDLSVAGGLEFTGGTNGTTKLLSDAGIQIADKGVTSEKLNAGTGDADRVGVADKDGNVVYKTLDEVVKSNETVTLLV
ncbi:hypothetical protein, partial [Myroides sp. N17-2]|uniref:beta strand repeat-containing protein n=1 Tax=Myroides sp. N17-2 TaxID=2030799 RepID=UPI00118095BA